MPRRRARPRTNYCLPCKQAVPSGQEAQMLNFNYLCRSCHDRGYRLESRTQLDQAGKMRRRTQLIPPQR